MTATAFDIAICALAAGITLGCLLQTWRCNRTCHRQPDGEDDIAAHARYGIDVVHLNNYLKRHAER